MTTLARISAWLPLLLLALAGCQAPPEPLRELYAEVRPGAEESGFHLVEWPLEADAFAAYVAVRPLTGEGIAQIDSLYAEVGDPKARKLVFPESGGVGRGSSACYLAHAAFPDGLKVVHHLRLLVVNRLPHPLRLLVASLAWGGEGEPEVLGVVTAEGERVGGAWEVAPGEGRTLHAFYRTAGLDTELPFGWELQGPPGPEGSPSAVGPWLFNVPLRRHYVCRGVPLSSLERRVVLGEELPPAREPDAPWAEPQLMPVPDFSGGAGDGAAGD